MKALKLKQIQNAKPGDKVVVASFVGTQVYSIRAVADGLAELEYPINGGKMASGGRHPLSCCYVPHKDQLAHKD